MDPPKLSLNRFTSKRYALSIALSITLCFALSIAAAGCGAPVVSLHEGAREYVSTDYDNVFKRWTREESLILFDELERALTVSATYQSWDFRWAYVIRYAKDYRLTIPERQRLLSKTLKETREHHEFFVALYGAKQKQNDLTKPDSAWIVRLIDATGNETAPSEIEYIKKPNILQRRYFPFNTVWRKTFRIRFPRHIAGQPSVATDARWVGLRFAGAWGNTDLVWKLRDRSDVTSTRR